jgi:hypothetical protein
VRRNDRDRESGTWRMSASATPGQLPVPRISESSITSLRGFRFTKGGREDYDVFTSPRSSQRSMCFGRGLSSASTVLAVRQLFGVSEKRRDHPGSATDPAAAGRDAGSAPFELPPKPGDLRAGLRHGPYDRSPCMDKRAARASEQAGQRTGITAVLRATNKTLSEWRRLLSCP